MYDADKMGLHPDAISNEYELSNAQKRIWFQQELNHSSTAYNLPKLYTFEYAVDIGVLEKTLNYMIQRHAALRTIIKEQNGIPKQMIRDYSPVKIPLINLNCGQGDELLQHYIEQDNKYVFDLSKQLYLFRLYQLHEKKYVLYLSFHHIIYDGWSQKIFDREFELIYDAFLHDRQPQLPKIKKQHLEWIYEKKIWLQTNECSYMEKYWTGEMGELIPKLELPIDFVRTKTRSYQGDYVTASTKGADILRQLAKKNGVSTHVLLLTVYFLFLHKLTGQNDIIVGIPYAERSEKDIENTIGIFINTLPVRIRFDKLKSFYDLLGYVKEKNSGAVKNGKYPFDLIIEKVNPERNKDSEALYATLFQYYDLLPMENGSSLFDLMFLCRMNGENLELRMNYSTDVLKKETVKRYAKYYINLIKQVIESEGAISLTKMELMDMEEKREVICGFNNTEVLYDKHTTLNQLFEKQAEKTPDAIAILFDGCTYTYRQINEMANRLAHVLRRNGVKDGSLVVIMMERCVELITGVLAILKAGGAYVPIDLTYPKERIDYILGDSKSSWLITRKQHCHEISFDGMILYADNDFSKEERGNPVCINESESIAYVIYTSGTTGIPKGVLVEHRSLINRLLWMKKAISLDANQIFVQKTTYTFDVSAYELFIWFFTGGKLCVLRPGEEKDPQAIIEAVEQYKITAIHFVPSMLQAFLQYVEVSNTNGKLKTLQSIFSSGETLQVDQVELCRNIFKNTSLQLYNLYGPTEAAIDVTACNCFDIHYERSIPIGRPISNVRIYIVGKNNTIQPVGIPGELCIAGDALARGYLNKPELTHQKFERNPFDETQNPFYHETVIYKTGDLAKWRYDGTIEYIGRLDSQVKIHGYRIELGEIRSNILKHNKISDAVITVNSKQQICVFFISQYKLEAQELQGFLARYLPDYMIPACYCQVDYFPLNHNGKIDVRKLSTMEIKQDIHGHEPVVNELQDEIRTIWSELLGIEKHAICITDRYFDLGGNSILLIQLHRLLMTKLGVKIGIVDLFTYNTIEKIEQYIIEQRQHSYFAKNNNTDCLKKRKYAIYKVNRREMIDGCLNGSLSNYNIDLSCVLFSAFLTLMANLSGSLVLAVRRLVIKGKEVPNPRPIDLSMVINFDSFIELMDDMNCNSGNFVLYLNPVNLRMENVAISAVFVSPNILPEFDSGDGFIYFTYEEEEIGIYYPESDFNEYVIRMLINGYVKTIEAILNNM